MVMIYDHVLLLVNMLFICLFIDFIYSEFKRVHASMHSAISLNKTEVLDDVLNNFSEVL